jgi:glycosyltransferase involved in cell wall biosynthesis
VKKIPQVSVIIPTWNRKSLLKKAIKSVLLQKGVSLEVLVCDDGSTDGTVEMMMSWQDPRVRFITGTRAGRPAIPRNRGIAEASGEWIAFLDDDDVWLAGKLQAQLLFAKEKGYLAVTTNALRFISSQKETILFHTEYIPECCDFATLLLRNYVITSSVLVHSSLLKRVERFPENVLLTAYEDYALWLRISSINSFGYIERPYIIYTDAPSTSIRQLVTNDNKLKNRVCYNWLAWAGRKTASRNGIAVLKEITRNIFKIYFGSISSNLKIKIRKFLCNTGK